MNLAAASSSSFDSYPLYYVEKKCPCRSSGILLHILIVTKCQSASSCIYIPTYKSRCSTGCTIPTLCFNSLSRHANLIQTSPELLAGAALNVTLDAALSTSAMMLKLSRTHGMTPREVGAMKDCVEELADSVDELRRSIEEMGQLRRTSNFGLSMNDIQTWVSAALTDETTCSDGFAGKVMNGNVKSAVRGQILTIAHLTSNALALVNRLASIHG